MVPYNAELLRQIFKDSLAHLGLSLAQATDWINSRLVEERIEYNYHQLYRFSQSGKNNTCSRRTLDRSMLSALARIGFWWDKEKNVPISETEIKQKIFSYPQNPNHHQLSLLELQEVATFKEQMQNLSVEGKVALLVPPSNLISQTKSPSHDKLMPSIYRKKRVDELSEPEFYKLKNWLTQSLNMLGRPGQPRTCAQENGFKGKIGENLNLLLEGDRNISLSKEDYVALSFILIGIKGWSSLQPLFKTPHSTYDGEWKRILLDLRRDPNGQPASL